MNGAYPDAKDDKTLQDGLEFQDFIADLFMKEIGISITSYSSRKWQFSSGENRQGIEIKMDRRMTDTGNVSIEVAEKSRADMPNWTPSGIMRQDNTWLYVQGNYKTVIVFGKATLKLFYEKYYKDKVWEPNKTIKTFLMPIAEARRIALKVFDLE